MDDAVAQMSEAQQIRLVLECKAHGNNYCLVTKRIKWHETKKTKVYLPIRLET